MIVYNWGISGKCSWRKRERRLASTAAAHRGYFSRVKMRKDEAGEAPEAKRQNFRGEASVIHGTLFKRPRERENTGVLVRAESEFFLFFPPFLSPFFSCFSAREAKIPKSHQMRV